MRRTSSTIAKCLFSAFLIAAGAAGAATYPELTERVAKRPPVGPYQSNGYRHTPSASGVATAYPAYGNTAMYLLPGGTNGVPDNRQVRWTYGQVNAASDPFYLWGLRTQGMYVPWSTPMSSWTNAQSWDWWRNRAGDMGPPPPLW